MRIRELLDDSHTRKAARPHKKDNRRPHCIPRTSESYNTILAEPLDQVVAWRTSRRSSTLRLTNICSHSTFLKGKHLHQWQAQPTDKESLSPSVRSVWYGYLSIDVGHASRCRPFHKTSSYLDSRVIPPPIAKEI